MTKRKKLLIFGLGILALIVVTGIAIANRSQNPVEVQAEVVQARDLLATVTASGFIQPRRQVDISADISGRVTDLYVEEGQWVDQGTILLRIDPTSYEANVRRATASVAQSQAQAAQSEANLLRSEREYARAEQLGPQNLISSAEVEQARTQLKVSQAQMEAAEYGVAQAQAVLSEAEEQLRKTTIAAPMSGQVTRLNIEEGETAIVGTMNNAGSLLLTIADLTAMEARVRVGETDIPFIENGDSAVVRIDAYPGQDMPGEVVRISNSAVNAPARGSAQAQTAQAIDFEVIVALDEPPPDLRPDLTATADIITATRRDAVTVPILAVTVRDANGDKFEMDTETVDPEPTAQEEEEVEVEGVFVIRNGKPEWVPVTLGIVGDWYFEVVDGLELGDTVISGPYAAVRDLDPNAEISVTAATTEAAAEQ